MRLQFAQSSLPVPTTNHVSEDKVDNMVGVAVNPSGSSYNNSLSLLANTLTAYTPRSNAPRKRAELQAYNSTSLLQHVS